MRAGEARTSVLVWVDENHADDQPGVIARLRAAGIEVHRTLGALGTVTGSIAPERLDALRAVEGVAEVEQAREHQLPPPESDIQ